MAGKIRVGVVSTSWWADMMYLPALQSHPQAATAAICGRNRGRAQEMAAKYNIPSVYTDYREMIERAGLDAVIVAPPDDLHYEVTLEALRAGLHVLCEKPMAMNAHQAREMYEKAQAAGVKHMIMFTYRWMPFFRYTHDLIDQGYIGRCYQCNFHFLMDWGRLNEYDWRLDQNRANGVLGDLGAHMIDLARWLVGDVTRVSAQLGVFGARPGLDGGSIDPANDSAILLAEFSNGAQGTIETSMMTHVADRLMSQKVQLYGEAGSLEVNIAYGGVEAGAVIRGARSDEKQFQLLETPAIYWGDASRSDPWEVFTRQPTGCRLFIDSIVEDRPVSPTFYDGYKAQQVIDAALEAHRSGQSSVIEE